MPPDVMKLLAITHITAAITLIIAGIMFITEVITCVRTEASYGFPSNKFVNIWACSTMLNIPQEL